MSRLIREMVALSPSSFLKRRFCQTLFVIIMDGIFHSAAFAGEIKTSFDDIKVGAIPPGWKFGFLGASGHPHWAALAEKSAPSQPNVLLQDGKATYSWLVAEAITIKDGSVQCAFKIESGKEDPEAGLIVRFINGKNYYYVRANTLENDVVFYRMVHGKKEVVKRVEMMVDAKKWHKFRIEFKAEEFRVFYDDKAIMKLKDTKIKDAGSPGFWTTADTVAEFDDFNASGT